MQPFALKSEQDMGSSAKRSMARCRGREANRNAPVTDHRGATSEGRSGDEPRGRQPFGSTTIVTSGVMPEYTRTATL